MADLDFSSMFARLAYLKLGLTPPEGDLYDIPGLEAHREGTKEIFSTLLFAKSAKRKIPSDIVPKLPHGWTLKGSNSQPPPGPNARL